VSSELVDLLATRLYVLESALRDLGDGAFHDLYVRLHPIGDAPEAEVEEFIAALARMYAGWGERRGMRVQRLDEEGSAVVLSISGLGAASILAPEAGLHVLEVVGDETREGDRPVDRIVVAVELAPQLTAGDARAVAGQVREAFRVQRTPTEIVRRYRPGASPLVRDAVRGYRTGRLERVLAGNFDLF
jgi:ATP-dependent Clp protease ATP-binding subunit ClpC